MPATLEPNVFSTVASSEYLARLQLTSSDYDYPNFFGADLPGLHFDEYGFEVWPTRPLAADLVILPQLRYLKLFFSSTFGLESSNTLFCRFDDPGGHGQFHRMLEISDFDPTMFLCRKAFVDMALTFGYPYIKHIREIKLTGCVKDCTKDRWQGNSSPRGSKERAEMERQVMERIEYLRTLPDEDL